MSALILNLHRARGATLGDLFGVDLPIHFGNPEAETRALYEGCALIDARFRSLCRATGEDRVSFLQGMLSNDVAKLKAGAAMDAAHLTIQGRIVADLRLYDRGDEFLVDVPVHRRQPLRDALEKFIVADDIELLDSDLAPLVILEGPAASRVLESLLGSAAAPVPPGRHATFPLEGVELFIVGVSHRRGLGYLLCGPESFAAPLWQLCEQAGATPAGMQALDTARIEAGVPWYGCDMDESVLAPEAGLSSSISFSKGCYLGQEIVERATARGQLQKKLVGLVGHGREVPERGARVSLAGDDIGWITSAAWSAHRNRIVAMGYVRRSAWAAGSEVEVVGTGSTLTVDDRVPSLA